MNDDDIQKLATLIAEPVVNAIIRHAEALNRIAAAIEGHMGSVDLDYKRRPAADGLFAIAEKVDRLADAVSGHTQEQFNTVRG